MPHTMPDLKIENGKFVFPKDQTKFSAHITLRRFSNYGKLISTLVHELSHVSDWNSGLYFSYLVHYSQQKGDLGFLYASFQSEVNAYSKQFIYNSSHFFFLTKFMDIGQFKELQDNVFQNYYHYRNKLSE
jgi:hypothetical protein